MPEVSPRPGLHCEASRKNFPSPECRAIAPERAFGTIFTPLFEPLVAEGILRKWLRGAPGHCSSLCNRSGAFREGRVFSNFEGISGWGVKTSECMVLSSCCGQQAIFFPKCWPIKELTRVWKLSLCARAPDRNYDISCFPIGPKANGDSGCTRFLRLWSLFRFCTRTGPTEAQVLPCAPARNNVSIPSYRGVEVRPLRSFTCFRLANYYFHHAHTGISL